MYICQRGMSKQKKNVCGSEQRSEHGLGLPILTNIDKYRQILIILALLGTINIE